ncbi:hypothetical protein [Pseudomonas shahriarae]|uniref:hypothetical protein n=1 Tax=Pseudomonas shahriarae TaxID=2745512 RepID=UPI00235E640D|nr:hypothetical protein [Pseudomonas shahriarae]MDD0981553.1 hypothetical protein [Pseudomonas shahriarae]
MTDRSISVADGYGAIGRDRAGQIACRRIISAHRHRAGTVRYVRIADRNRAIARGILSASDGHCTAGSRAGISSGAGRTDRNVLAGCATGDAVALCNTESAIDFGAIANGYA